MTRIKKIQFSSIFFLIQTYLSLVSYYKSFTQIAVNLPFQRKISSYNHDSYFVMHAKRLKEKKLKTGEYCPDLQQFPRGSIKRKYEA